MVNGRRHRRPVYSGDQSPTRSAAIPEPATTWRVAFFANGDRPEIEWISVNEPRKVIALILSRYPSSAMERLPLLQPGGEEKSGRIWKDEAARDGNCMPVGMYFTPDERPSI